MTLILRPAKAEDADVILEWRAEAASWLFARYQVDQWQVPFPRPAIAATIAAGQVWMLYEAEQPIATITLTNTDDPAVWTANELNEPARYIHKLTVRPIAKGRNIGSALIDWASARTASQGAEWLRLDAWTTNPHLHRYYEKEGFRYIRTVKNPAIASGALFERPAGTFRGIGPDIKEEVTTACPQAGAPKKE